MSWSGDISAMGLLADRAADLSHVPAVAAPRAARAIQRLVEAEFADGHDPYGDPWTPLSEATEARGRAWPPLTDTGDMAGSLNVYARADGHGVAITIDHPAAPHQTGWIGPQGTGPKRAILPDRGMPEAWAEAIDEAIGDAVIETMRGAT